MDAGRLELQQAQDALVRLLEAQGAYCAGDDVEVKRLTSNSGAVFYSVIARNGTEQPLSHAIEQLALRGPSTGFYGVWVLRPKELQQLLEIEAVHA